MYPLPIQVADLEMAKEKMYTLITTFGLTFEKNELYRNV